jgi:aarF domain-containing kinase
VQLLLLFFPLVASSPLALCGPFRREVWFQLLKWTLAQAGTAFIKWGQWVAVRPDLFPEALCAALSTLHSDAPVHNFAHTRRTVEAALGAPLEELFAAFEPEALASGSIAQVHRAQTPQGETVAVKVRHPGVVRRIVQDFTLMRKLAEATHALPFLRYLNLKASVGQFSETMVAQTRLDIEGEHLDRFNWNFGTEAWRDIAFPRTRAEVGPPAHPDVLVESFEPGELVSKYTLGKALGLAGQEQLPRDLAHFVVSRGEDLYLKMLLMDNLMHADLHPGNILLDARRGQDPRIVLLDVGMVARLTAAEANAFIGLLRAMGAGNGRKAARAVLCFAEMQQVCASPERIAAFETDMGDLFADKCRGFGTSVDFGEVLRGVLSLVRTHQVTLEANYMTLVMNVLCLEGMARQLLPEYNVLDAARPLLAAHRWLPRWAFKALMPLIRRLKGLRDRRWLRKLDQEERRALKAQARVGLRVSGAGEGKDR